MTEKILVVDDEIALQETLAYSLKEATALKSGWQSWAEMARNVKPDLVVLDVMLPGKTALRSAAFCAGIEHSSVNVNSA